MQISYGMACNALVYHLTASLLVKLTVLKQHISLTNKSCSQVKGNKIQSHRNNCKKYDYLIKT